MHLVYDFDRTLYNTEVLWQEWLRLLSVAYGVDSLLARTQATKLFEQGFTLEKHLAELGIEVPKEGGIVQQLSDFTRRQGSALVFHDVIDFLKTHVNHEQRILTHGDDEYQLSKIVDSGIFPYMKEIWYAHTEVPKHTFLSRLVCNGEPIFFIDDTPSHLEAVVEAGLPVNLVRMCRQGETQHGDHPLDNKAWTCVYSLQEFGELF